jgi:hypothetical protein
VQGSGATLTFPDYPGNAMYQTLGNLLIEPRVGLAFVDFSARTVLQLRGTGELTSGGPDGGAGSVIVRLRDAAVSSAGIAAQYAPLDPAMEARASPE